MRTATDTHLKRDLTGSNDVIFRGYRWIKFDETVLKDWDLAWDLSSHMKAVERPHTARILPAIRLGPKGRPAISDDHMGHEKVLASYYAPDRGDAMYKLFYNRDEDEGYGSNCYSVNLYKEWGIIPFKRWASPSLDEAFDSFRRHCGISLNAMKAAYLKEGGARQPQKNDLRAEIYEGYGNWA
jgi:hypothetical protein